MNEEELKLIKQLDDMFPDEELINAEWDTHWPLLVKFILARDQQIALEARIKISDDIKRQRENYRANSLFGAEYQVGMSDAAVIAYDADRHGWFDGEGKFHAS